MQEQWFLEPGGRAYSLDQLQVMIDAGELKATDLVSPDGVADPVLVSTVPGLRVRKGIRLRTWLLAAGAGLAILIVVAMLLRSGDDDRDDPDLPEYFHSQYRIKTKRAIIFPPKKTHEKNKEQPRTPSSSPPEMYSPAWLDEHFTHYIDFQNAFVWRGPRVVWPSDGKIMAGIKVIVGKEVGEMSLTCAITDGRPENMYIQNMNLRPRSMGPPPIPND